MRDKIVTIFGGTGFLGRYVIKELSELGAKIRVVSRAPYRADLSYLTCGSVGQVSISCGDISDENSLRDNIRGSDVVINLVGLLCESGKQNFAKIHIEAAQNIAKFSAKLGVKSLIHVSALLDDNAALKSKYAKSKRMAEKEILQSFPKALIIRPSIMFGPEDNFFNQFARIGKFSPILPLFYGGKTRFQPVYVDDVAKAIAKLLEHKYEGKIVELGGNEIYNFKELLEFLLETLNANRYLLKIPNFMAKFMAFFMELMPSPWLTRDQLNLLKFDNVIIQKPGIIYFNNLGINPRPIELIVPNYVRSN